MSQSQQTCRLFVQEIQNIYSNGEYIQVKVVTVKNEHQECNFKKCQHKGFVLFIYNNDKYIPLCPCHASLCSKKNYLKVIIIEENVTPQEYYSQHPKWKCNLDFTNYSGSIQENRNGNKGQFTRSSRRLKPRNNARETRNNVRDVTDDDETSNNNDSVISDDADAASNIVNSNVDYNDDASTGEEDAAGDEIEGHTDVEKHAGNRAENASTKEGNTADGNEAVGGGSGEEKDGDKRGESGGGKGGVGSEDKGDGSDNNSNGKSSASVNNDASNVTVSVEVQHQGEVVYNASIQPNENVSAVRTLVKAIVGSEVALCLDDKRTHTNDTKSLSEIANDDGDVFLVAFVVDWEATRETRSMSPTLDQLIDLLTFAYNIRLHDVGAFCKVLTKVSAVIQEVIVGKKQDGNNNDIGEDENIAIIKLIEVLELIVEKRSGLNLLEQLVRDLNAMLALHVSTCMNESGTSNISINAHNNVEGKDCSVDEKKNGSKTKKPRVSAEDAAEDELYSCPCCDRMLLYPFPKVVIEVEGVSNNWQNTIVRPCKDDFLDTSDNGWKRHHKGSYCHPVKTNHITAWSPSPEVGEDKFLTEKGLGQALAGTFIAAFIQSYLHPIDEVKTFFSRFTKNILLKQDKLNSESVQNVFFREFNKNFTGATLKDKVGSGLNAAVTKKVPKEGKEGVDSCALKAFLPKRSDIFVILKSDALNAIKYVMRALQGSPYPKEFDFDNGYDSDNVDSTEVGDKQQLVLVDDRVTNVNSITNLLMNILFYKSNERILKVCKNEMQGSPLVDQIKKGAEAMKGQVQEKAKMMAELIHFHFVDVKKHVDVVTGMQKNVQD